MRRVLIVAVPCVVALVALMLLSAPDEDVGVPTSEHGNEVVGVASVTNLSTARQLDSLASALAWDAYYDSAAVIFAIAAERYELEGNSESRALALVNQGAAERDAGKYEAGLSTIQRADSIARSDGVVSPSSRNEIDLALALTLVRCSQYDSALRLLRSMNIEKGPWTTSDSLFIGRHMFAIGWANHEQEQLVVAERNYRRAVELFPKTRRGEFEATWTLNALANLNDKQGLSTRARTIHNEILARRRALLRDDHPLIAATTANIGLTHMSNGEPLLGIGYYLEATDIYRRNFGNRHPEVARCYTNLASFYEQLGDIDTAWSFAQKAAQIRRLVLPKGHSTNRYTFATLGQLAMKRGLYQDAIDWYRKVLAIEQSRLDTRTTAYLGIATASDSLQRTQEARQFYRKAVDASRSLAGRMNVASRIAELEFLRRVQPDLHLEIRLLDVCRDADHDLGKDHNLSVRCQVLMAERQQYRGRYHVAESQFQSIASRIMQKADRSYEDSRNLIRALNGIAKCQRLQAPDYSSSESRLHAASRALRASVEETIALRRRFDGLEAWRHSLTHAERPLRDLVDVNLELFNLTDSAQYLADAYWSAQAVKSQLLFDLASTSYPQTWRQPLDTTELALKRHLRRELAEPFTAREASVDSALGSLGSGRPDHTDLMRLRNGLEHGETLVEYAGGMAGWTVFVLTTDSLRAVSISKGASIKPLADSLRSAISSHDYHAFIKYARELYKLLVEPIEDHIVGKHLIVVPDGPLHFVPFEVLLTEDVPDDSDMRSYRTIPYLIRKNAISYSYSATLMHQLRSRRRPTPPRSFLGVAPVFERELPKNSKGELVIRQNTDTTATLDLRAVHLPASLQEVKRIKSLFARKRPLWRRMLDSKADLLIHEDASELNVKNAKLDQYRFVHLATHAFANESHPDLSGLVMAMDHDGQEDGVLHLNEVYNLKTNADLVVLSACETGLGKLATGEGIIGLTRGFLYAGASNVMVSLWKADDVTTRDVMVAFYESLLDGSSRAEALRQAKLTQIATSPVHARPFFWAQFVLIGE